MNYIKNAIRKLVQWATEKEEQEVRKFTFSVEVPDERQLTVLAIITNILKEDTRGEVDLGTLWTFFFYLEEAIDMANWDFTLREIHNIHETLWALDRVTNKLRACLEKDKLDSEGKNYHQMYDLIKNNL